MNLHGLRIAARQDHKALTSSARHKKQMRLLISGEIEITPLFALAPRVRCNYSGINVTVKRGSSYDEDSNLVIYFEELSQFEEPLSALLKARR